MRYLFFMILILVGCPKKEEPVEQEPRSYELEWPEDEDLEDLPEDTGI